MKGIQELTWQQLASAYPPSDFSFKTTDDLEFLDEVIGQERAKKAMEFGLLVEVKGYNIYISGEPGTGKVTFAKTYAHKVASNKARANDWCYVYNFNEVKVPKALKLAPGDGRRFKNDMDELIAYLTKEIPYIYSTGTHEEHKEQMIDEYRQRKKVLISQLKEHGKVLGFSIEILEGGIGLTPLNQEGLPINDEEFEALEPEEQLRIEKSSALLSEVAKQVIKKIQEHEQDTIQEIENLEYDMALVKIGYYIKELKESYAGYEDIQVYLDHLQQDILDHLNVFIEVEGYEDNSEGNLFAWGKENNINKLIDRYGVNLLVDHSESLGAPVVIGEYYSYNRIFGELSYGNEMGTLSTDHMKIKGGLLHQANGGYLILQVEEILASYEIWNGIKQVLRSGKIVIENPTINGVTTITTLRPEAIPIDLKVILVGSRKLYRLLYENDIDFKKLFKVRADFDNEMCSNQTNINLVARFIKTFCKKQLLLPFSAPAVRAVLRYAARYVENQTKITTEFDWIINLIIEASTFASLQGATVVETNHVHLAIEEKRYRSGLYEEKLGEQIRKNTFVIDTNGSKVGEVNGLTVHDTGEYRFGQPIKITATTYKGQDGIISIDHQAKLNGPIHTKGIQIIRGYLGQTYGQDAMLPLTCQICFEQSYGKVDGDSASSAELYSIISSLSGIPIKQSIAVTGSMNQHGMIQPVGGVTHKVEGFFSVCQSRGLTGKQGVIIPKHNIEGLVLKDEVVEAVKKGQFHIYAISHVKEGIEILMEVSYLEVDKKIRERLIKFSGK